MSYKLQSPKPRRDEIEKQVKREKKKITQREHLSVFFFLSTWANESYTVQDTKSLWKKEKVTKEL